MTRLHMPRVRGNDWSVLEEPTPGEWAPTRTVSVVIPAYRAERTLPYTLAALSAQSYPSHLLEVVVVDDGGDGAVDLPELRPENTRVIRAETSWGRANACREGAAAADGEVVHWLDADMVPSHEQIERQMRWHHTIDHAVVLGHKVFIEADELPTAADVHQAVVDDELEKLFDGRWTEEHEWVERIWRRTDELRGAGFRAFHVHVGATASVDRAFYQRSGEMDPTLKLGEDIELGYRLSARGGIFIADRSATSWHLGRSTLMRHEQEVQRYNAPFIAERVPDFRKFRQERGRSYRVPHIEVVVDVTGETFERVKYTVDGVLRTVPSDLVCVLRGAWSELHDERRHPLLDPHLDLRLVREEYGSDGRVRFSQSLGLTAFPAQYRLRMPVGWRPGQQTLDKLTKAMQNRVLGLVSVLLPDGGVVRLERTAAFERALRVMDTAEDLDDVVDAVSGTWWSEGLEEGFIHVDDAAAPVPPHRARRPERPAAPAPPAKRASWKRLMRASARRLPFR